MGITTEKLKSLTIGQSTSEKMKDKKHLQRVRNYAHKLQPDYLFSVTCKGGIIEATRLVADTPISVSARMESMKPGEVIHLSKTGSVRAMASMADGSYRVRMVAEVEKL